MKSIKNYISIILLGTSLISHAEPVADIKNPVTPNKSFTKQKISKSELLGLWGMTNHGQQQTIISSSLLLPNHTGIDLIQLNYPHQPSKLIKRVFYWEFDEPNQKFTQIIDSSTATDIHSVKQNWDGSAGTSEVFNTRFLITKENNQLLEFQGQQTRQIIQYFKQNEANVLDELKNNLAPNAYQKQLMQYLTEYYKLSAH